MLETVQANFEIGACFLVHFDFVVESLITCNFLQVCSSIKSCGDLCHLLKARIFAEEEYSKSLAKASAIEISYDGGGKLQSSLDQMKVISHLNRFWLCHRDVILL